jgi:hypothetical protein
LERRDVGAAVQRGTRPEGLVHEASVVSAKDPWLIRVFRAETAVNSEVRDEEELGNTGKYGNYTI